MTLQDLIPWLLTLLGGLGLSVAFLIAFFFTFTIVVTFVKLPHRRRHTLVVRSLDELVPADPVWPKPIQAGAAPDEARSPVVA